LTVDAPAGTNRGVYRIGRDLDADGVVTGGWTEWLDVPDWFSWENSGAGVALVDRGGTHDLVVFTVDDAAGNNQAFYRALPGLQSDGGAAGNWGPLLGVPGWFSWDNAGAAIAVDRIGGKRQLVVVMVDVPVATTRGYYRLLELDEEPPVHGAWEVVPAHSGVLAIHAALLPTGRVLFFAGSGNNQVRRKSPDYGSVAKGIYTSAVWDPVGGAVTHPPTIRGNDGDPFDFFCGGDTFLPDGLLLSAGGNQAYVARGRPDAVAFDPGTEQWQHRAAMARGRWYPTLLALGDGTVLAVSGLDGSGTQLNPLFEIYDPGADTWRQLPIPQQPLFFGLPLYPHLFLMADGRVFFDGGRMDDARPQGPVTIDLTTDPLTITGVPGLEAPETRNQAASVLLPPAQDQRVMIMGGGPEDLSNGTGSTAVVDLTAAVPAFVPGPPMGLPRMHLNAVLLPDRTVFVSGGALAREDRVGARLQSEVYDPVANEWRAAATATVVRMYHSIALLLPDGRVVAAGGNPPDYGDQVPWEPPHPNEEMRLEIYSPAYLFRGPRPVITAVPAEAGYATDVAISTPDADAVVSVSAIRPGVTTHAFDNSQRLVDLPIVGRTADGLTVRTPVQATIAPPGWYMVFLLDHAGVPSVASWLRLA
jgi:hypothetical protein